MSTSNNSLMVSPENSYPVQEVMDDVSAPASGTQFRRFLLLLRKYWWVPAITLVLALGGAALYIRWLEPDFASTASLWETERLNLPGGAAFTEDSQTYIGTQLELLRNGQLAARVIRRLYEAGSNTVPRSKEGGPLKVTVSVKQVPKSTIFLVDASSSNPAYSRAYLNALLEVYLEYKSEVRKGVAMDTVNSISEQVRRKETDLKTAQDELNSFEQTNHLAMMHGRGTVGGEHLAKLQTELSDLQLESRIYDAIRGTNTQGAHAESGLANAAASLETEPRTLPHESANPSQQLQLLKSRREDLSLNLRPKHPKIVKLDKEIAQYEKILDILDKQTAEQAAMAREANKVRMANIVASIKDWEVTVTEAETRLAEAERLRLDVGRAQSEYDRVAQLLQTVDISRNTDQETLRILDPASPARRSYAKEIGGIEVAGFGGIGLGLGIVFLIGRRDDRFHSLAEVNEKFGDVIVGQVPNLELGPGEPCPPLLAVEDDRNIYAESYRNLRSAIVFMPSVGGRPKILLVTSAVPNEGKSSVSANLSRTLALGGSRVLLIDADLRRGYLHDLLGLRCEPGLSDLLENPEDLDAIIQQDSLPGFFFIARGKNIPNPGDVFLSQKLDALFAELRGRFDHVVIDTSPVFATDDAPTLAPKADGTLVVVCNRYSSARVVKQALDILSQRQVRVLGLVFNRADSSARSYYYYKHAEYYRRSMTA